MTLTIKKRIVTLMLAFVCALTAFPVTQAFAANDYSQGGWSMIYTTSTVKKADGTTVGTVSAGEGVTVLYYSGSKAWIEYSASGTAKQGFIPTVNLLYGGTYPGSCVGKVTANKTTYYSPSTSLNAGSISSGEFVSVLCKKNGWAYVEYNVTSSAKRKRAFITTSSLTCYGTPNSNFYHDSTVKDVSGIAKTVYAGPSSKYPSIGQIYSTDIGVKRYAAFLDHNGNTYYYVSYPTSGGTKYGYYH